MICKNAVLFELWTNIAVRNTLTLYSWIKKKQLKSFLSCYRSIWTLSYCRRFDSKFDDNFTILPDVTINRLKIFSNIIISSCLFNHLFYLHPFCFKQSTVKLPPGSNVVEAPCIFYSVTCRSGVGTFLFCKTGLI